MGLILIKNCKDPILKEEKRVQLIKERKIRKCNKQIIYKLLMDKISKKALLKIWLGMEGNLQTSDSEILQIIQ